MPYDKNKSFEENLAELTRDKNPVMPGDEQNFPNSPRNLLVNRLGLPQGLRQSVADEKQYMQQLPEIMGTSMGSARNIAKSALPAIEQTGLKLLPKAENALTSLSPELRAMAEQMKTNPKMPIEVTGAINIESFQKLRDLLGHTGPIIHKFSKR